MATYSRPLPYKAIHPGSLLKDELEYRGIKQKEFAKAIGMQPSNFNDIIKGKRSISDKISMAIGAELGVSGSVWLNLQHQYDEDLIRIAEREREESLATEWENQWTNVFDLKTLYKRLEIACTFAKDRIRKLIEVIGGDPMQMELSAGFYKRTETSSSQEREKGVRTWQLIVTARGKQTQPPSATFTPQKGEQAAIQIATLARESKATPEVVREILEEAGFYFIEEPNFEHCPVDAFSMWYKQHPLIAVTKRYDNRDKFAFDILHEMAHVLLHISQDKTASFIDVDSDYSKESGEEREANAFAANRIISPGEWKAILTSKGHLRDISHHKIIEIVASNAKSLGISPSVAVARYKQENSFYTSKRYASPKLK